MDSRTILCMSEATNLDNGSLIIRLPLSRLVASLMDNNYTGSTTISMHADTERNFRHVYIGLF